MKIRITGIGLLLIYHMSVCTSTLQAQDKVTEIATFEKLGTIKARSSAAIKSSIWSIGAETLDRDYADYNSYKKYLGKLGAKRIRLQSGWAKTEKQKNVYQWSWLDSIVQDAVTQGLKPWMQIGYGNSIYEGGGNGSIDSHLPSTPEALKAWDAWIVGLIARYKGKITEWEIWNEVDHHGDDIKPQQYADFYIHTTRLIQSIQPDAKFVALALTTGGFMDMHFAKAFLDALAKEKMLSLVHKISFHYYDPIPETMYPHKKSFDSLIAVYSKNIQLWQGESGSPSTNNSSGGLRNYNWSERSQAKYVLRRMLDDITHHLEVSSIFQISDMIGYAGKTNSKGLLKANPDKTIAYAKPSYYAMQHMTTLFNDGISATDKAVVRTSNPDSVATAFFTNKQGNYKFISLCQYKIHSSDETPIMQATVFLSNINLKDPVYIDLLTGTIFRIPEQSIKRRKNGIDLLNIPVPDYPILISDASSIAGKMK